MQRQERLGMGKGRANIMEGTEYDGEERKKKEGSGESRITEGGRAG